MTETLCLILVRYPASQNCEGEKHQPGFVAQGPASTEACWIGGEGGLEYFHCFTNKKGNEGPHLS